ncbi:hypothetical protein [Acidovorax sp. SRB_14]|uniref:hypothetical protein n=1 Tax=Acidovorax sp. SRB_14 TaxID=1962699 RepID=UPI00146ADE66|nr:hypothetical protein [Acidovorax sp. SRB_14]
MAAPTPRQGLGVWAPELNAKVASAQQALAFLDELSSQLQDVKAQLSLKLAGSYVREGALEKQQHRLAQLWKDRAEHSGHRLDAQLAYSGDTPARQRFRIRGLDQQSLQASGQETLVFSLNGAPRHTMSLRIEAGLPPAALAGRFNRALVPAGIQVSPNAQGQLDYFTVPEAQWPQVRDSLAIKGDGKRFPTGQFARVRAEPEPAIIDPGAWELDGPSGLRQALPQIVRAAQQSDAARAEVLRSLADAEHSLSRPETAGDVAAVRAFAQSFEEQTRTANYPILSAVSPSLLGLPRYRIDSLLALP